MPKLNPSQDMRTTYDEETGAVRSFFGTELVEVPAGATLEAKKAPEQFLKANKDLFKLDGISLTETETVEGSSTRSVRYQQEHNTLPVYGAEMVVSMRKSDNQISSAVNGIDYDLPPSLGPAQAQLTEDAVIEQLTDRFETRFDTLEFGTPNLFVYRHRPVDADGVMNAPAIRGEMLGLTEGTVGQPYLVWQVFMDTTGPDGQWELLVDASNGKLVAVKDRRRYATLKGNVFWPDPIRSSQNDNLSWSTLESTLNNELKEVDLLNLTSPSNGKYKLEGTWVKNAERESPTFAPPEATSNFKFTAKKRKLLNVMVYFYLDELIRYLRDRNLTAYNNAATSAIEVDPQGFSGEDNSHFVVPVSGSMFIAFGEGGVPDAADPGVIVHEYGHALHYLIGSEQTSYEEGFNDFLAAAWLDRFNVHQFQREEAMPWDQHFSGTSHWGPTRRMDLSHRFDDSGFAGYGMYLKGNVLATALWDIFLNIGGDSDIAAVREAAANRVISTYMEMLTTVVDNTSSTNQFNHARVLANALIAIDGNRTGGLHKKVIWDAFRRRGLWTNLTQIGNVDLYIRDSAGDTGAHASPQVHWHSPDIWVRNNPPPADPTDPTDPNFGENPDDGHQPPINNVPNYLYVNVHNRGTQAAQAGTFSVEAFNCNPGTGMLWPTHFNSMGTLTITQAIPASGSARIGPFIWTPQIVDHECLLAVVNGASDPAITATVSGVVDHWKLVRFDNNVGQRNVSPQNAVPGGKTKTSFMIRGTTHPSINTLNIDASELPSDTSFTLRLARTLVDEAASMSGFQVQSSNSRWMYLSLEGGAIGRLEDFPLATREEKNVSMEIDFSHQAEDMKVYPIVIGQEQDGVLAGQLTIEITAVKESEDYVYGNPRSMELHTIHCPYWPRISQKNKIPFARVQDGLARGYDGCAFCLPEYHID